MSQHLAFRQSGGAPGVLQHRDGLVQITDRMSLIPAVVGHKVPKGDVLVVGRDIRQLLGRCETSI